MKWTLTWFPTAEDDLARCWLEASPTGREEITRIVNWMEAELRKRPHEIGNLRSDGYREIILLPVGMVFEVNDADCLARVLAIQVVPEEGFLE